MKIPLLSAFFKPYVDAIKRTISNLKKPELTAIEQLENDKEVIKAAFDNDIIDLDEYLTQLGVVKDQIKQLQKKKQSYADAVITNDKGEILLLRRAITDTFHPDCWSLPGGKIEPGETPEQAVIRETEEETNLTIISATPLLEKEIEGGCIYYFLCEVKQDMIEASIILDNNEHINHTFADEIERKRMNLILDLKDTLFDFQKIIDKEVFMSNLFSKGEIDDIEYEDYISKAIKQEPNIKVNTIIKKWSTKSELKQLAKHAKNASHEELEATIKEAKHPQLREHAHKELERREKEERSQDAKDGYEGHEYHGKEFKYNSEHDVHMDDEGNKANPQKLYEYYTQRHKEQSTQLDAIKGDLETSTKDKQALKNKLVKTYYDKVKKTRYVGDEKSAYDVALLKLEKVGLQKEDVDHDKVKKIISKKIGQRK